jgi:hypothetical protein
MTGQRLTMNTIRAMIARMMRTVMRSAECMAAAYPQVRP